MPLILNGVFVDGMGICFRLGSLRFNSQLVIESGVTLMIFAT